MSKKYKRRPAARFLQLHHRLLKSHAWHSLTPLQRCGYLEIAQLYDGTNNGRLAMSVRRLAGLIPCNKDSHVLRDLEDAGFIATIRVGKYTRKAEERTASEYRLTDFKCDVTGELPTRDYNERQRWEPAEQPWKKALNSAERVKRHRQQCNDERMGKAYGSVPLSHTLGVTHPKGVKGEQRILAKTGAQTSDVVTLTVPPSHTLIHLTRGTPANIPILEGKTIVALSKLPPGHAHCKLPKVKTLPPGWHWCRSEGAVVTDTGVVVPIVDDPLIGTDEQRDALRFLARSPLFWNHSSQNGESRMILKFPSRTE